MARLLESLAEQLDLPAEAFAGVPRVIISGTERVLIENHKGILAYTETEVEVSGGATKIRIRGDGLLLRGMTAESLTVTGRILAVEMG